MLLPAGRINMEKITSHQDDDNDDDSNSLPHALIFPVAGPGCADEG
jgi:hypothetical protein